MTDPILVSLLLAILAMLAVVLILLARRRPSRDPDGSRISMALQASGLYQQVGRVERMAQEMASAGTELRGLFRLRPEVGAVGEFQLEAILADLLPRNRFAMRTNFVNVGTPDAAVRTKDGWLLIDSKFPVDAYRNMVSMGQKNEPARRRFSAAVRHHLDAVATKYVRPDSGTLPLAVAFIPSESIFTTAVDSDPHLLRDAYRRGVLIASPTTLASHLAIISAGIRAEEVGRAAVQIQAALRTLERQFRGLRSDWETLSRHVGNAHGKLPDVTRQVESIEATLQAAVQPGIDSTTHE